MQIQPTIYSKAKTVNILLDKLNEYPEQKCNTPQACKGLVVEFVDVRFPTGPVGSLPEFTDAFDKNEFEISIENSIITVVNENGKYVAKNVKEI